MSYDSPLSPSRRRVVITGIGPLTCIGTGKEAFWSNIRAGHGGITRISGFDTSSLHARCGGEIRDWDPARFFPPHRLKRLDRYAQFSVASALLAIEDAGLPFSKETPQPRIGVSFGTALGGIANAEVEHRSFLEKGWRGVTPTLAHQVFGGSAHANIAIECGFRGVGTTNSNSCASGVISVGEAMRYIRDGMADVMIAGGAEAPLSPLTFGAFDFIKTMSRWEGDPAAACRPFDLHRDGFVMGEGAASLVIEEYDHAVRRGAHIYAEVLGYALNNEAWHMTTPLPGGESVVRCMKEALADAAIQPGQIDYINAHASGTQMNDANESACIQAVFGNHSPAVSGTKAFTAHPLGATGAIETAICALASPHSFPHHIRSGVRSRYCSQPGTPGSDSLRHE
ncbi:MAG: beta-ketoacyl synthase N-terminal-like domain-containing protein [Verrucomicrobiota bacterium]